MKDNILKGCFRLLVIVVILLGSYETAQAGFGISPPYLKNQQLVPGSKYDQKITLLRSSSDGELKAEIKIDAPEIASWITIDKGQEFILPKGEVQVPMIVTVNVPKDAELGNYKGSLNIKISSTDSEKKAGVAIALGARVDVDLTLTNISHSDFVVRSAIISDFELPDWPWNWKIFSRFLHRVAVKLKVENIGNVKIAPSKVSLEIYDIAKEKLLESSVDQSFEKVEPFSTKEISAHFPTKLPAGQYWGKVKVYKDNNIVNVYEIAFTIAKPGELGDKNPGLGYLPWLILGGYLAGIVILIILLIKVRIWRLFFKLIIALLSLIALIFKPVFGKLFNLAGSVNKSFWQWIGKKASKYNNDRGKD